MNDGKNDDPNVIFLPWKNNQMDLNVELNNINTTIDDSFFKGFICLLVVVL